VSWKLKEKYRAILSAEDGYHKKVGGDFLKIGLVYPNTYRAGMSNLGFQTVYDLFNRHPASLCERVFLPDPEDEAEFTRGSIPLFSLESQRPLIDFDILAFSLSFENDYPNILKILSVGGIPLLSAERKERDPLIMGGGIAVTLNPEPLADFFDLFVLGEGEEVIELFLEACVTAGRSGLVKEQLLFHLQKEMEGVYVPRFYQVSYAGSRLIEDMTPVDEKLPRKIKKRRISDINSFRTEQCITTRDTELGEMFLTEVSRGCPRGCRFCAAGFVCRPARFRKAELLEASFLRGLESRKKIGLLGTAVSDHPYLLSLCRFIRERGGAVAIGSLRLDKLDAELVQLLKEGGAETLSLAPEAGSQRLRDVINKGITEEHISRAVEMLTEQGIPNIRLYFMVGLPTEEDEDISAIIQLTKKIKHLAGKHSLGKRPFRRITLSINQFIPKAATPFQWCPLTDINTVKKRVRKIDNALRREASVRVIHDLPKWNYVQALLSLGDRRVGQILLSVHRHGGNWPQAIKEVNVNPDFYVYRQKDLSEILPWDFIDHGVSKAFLLTEYRESFPAKTLTNETP
jgi:radical SAM family uncharacterized protein